MTNMAPSGWTRRVIDASIKFVAAGLCMVPTGCVTPRIDPVAGSRILTNTLLPGPVRQLWGVPGGIPHTLLPLGSKYVAMGTREGRIVLFTRETGAVGNQWLLEQPLIALLPVGSERQQMVAIAEDGTVVQLSPGEPDPLVSMATGLTVTHAGLWLGEDTLWLRHDDQVSLLDLKTSKLIPAPESGPWSRSAVSPDGTRLLLSREDGPPAMWTQVEDNAWSGEPVPYEVPFEVLPAWAPDGKSWLLAGAGRVWIERSGTQSTMVDFETEVASPQSVAWLPREKTVGIAGSGTLALQSIWSGKTLHRWQGRGEPVWAPSNSDVLHALTPGSVALCDAGA